MLNRKDGMGSISAFAAKTRFGELLERVAHGEEIVITRHDKPVARIIPEGRHSLVQIQETVSALRALQAKIQTRIRGQKALTRLEIRSAIETGRR
jgi:prevent-host-death family protein